MLNFFEPIEKILKLEKTCIDSEVFRLHYKVTVIIFISLSLLVTGKEYFGDPIDCIQGDQAGGEFIDTYCWIHSTFTLPSALGKSVGDDVPHPGIDKYTPGEKRVYHKYYQWVCFALFLQGILFYVPRYIWKSWEGGRIRSLIQSLNNPVLGSDEKKSQVALLNKYLILSLRENDVYFWKFFFCEFLNFANVVSQICFIDIFLGGSFTTYGWDVLKHSEMEQEERVDPMIKVFPRMTKCTFHFFGSSGDLQRHDALCILPLNIINEKIYVFVWFWLVLLALITSISIFTRILLLLSPQIRLIYLRSQARFVDRYHLNYVVKHISSSDWFLLMQIRKNIDAVHFRDLMTEFSRSLKNSTDSNGNGKALLEKSNIESGPESS